MQGFGLKAVPVYGPSFSAECLPVQRPSCRCSSVPSGTASVCTVVCAREAVLRWIHSTCSSTTVTSRGGPHVVSTAHCGARADFMSGPSRPSCHAAGCGEGLPRRALHAREARCGRGFTPRAGGSTAGSCYSRLSCRVGRTSVCGTTISRRGTIVPVLPIVRHRGGWLVPWRAPANAARRPCRTIPFWFCSCICCGSGPADCPQSVGEICGL